MAHTSLIVRHFLEPVKGHLGFVTGKRIRYKDAFGRTSGDSLLG